MLARKTILIRTPATAYLQARRSQARTSKSAPLRRRGQIRLTEIRYNSVENGPSGHDRKAASRRSSPRLDPRSSWMPKPVDALKKRDHRSEDRRVGNECTRKCRYRWA